MRIYQINCHSNCGSYFNSYLQSVTVVAEDKDDAIAVVKKWFRDNHTGFIYPEEKWLVELIKDSLERGVVDYYEGKDY